MSTSHEQESHGSKRRSSFETTPPHKKSRIDLLFSNDDAIEPNLAFWNNTEASDEEEVEEEHQPFQRSLHSALLLSSNIDEHERRKSLLLLPEDDEDVDQDELTTLPISKIQADFDDEVDAFFSSRNNDPAEFVMSSSLKMSLLQQQNSLTGGYPAFFTTFPHFLNTEYFESHLPSDRMIPQQQVEESKSTGYFDATFQILGHLDSGEYSDVWKARDDQDNICAIKKLKVSFMSWDHRWEQITEVEHLLKLQNSKHCVQLLNAWEQEGYLYLQMELCTAGR
jgi:hypothetical protein